MARTLRQVIEDWERKHLVNVGTVQNAKRGGTVKPLMARQIAKAFGAEDSEADAIAAQYASQAEEKSA